MTIGTRIREARKARGLTQKALGELAGIAEPTIRKYESDRLHPKLETLEKLAAPLNVTAGYLRDGKPRLGDRLLSDLPSHAVVLPLDDSLYAQLCALAEQRDMSPEELAVELLSDAAFAALEAGLQAGS